MKQPLINKIFYSSYSHSYTIKDELNNTLGFGKLDKLLPYFIHRSMLDVGCTIINHGAPLEEFEIFLYSNEPDLEENFRQLDLYDIKLKEFERLIGISDCLDLSLLLKNRNKIQIDKINFTYL